MKKDEFIFVNNKTDKDCPEYDIYRSNSTIVFGTIWYGSQSKCWFLTLHSGEEIFEYYEIKQIYKFMKKLNKEGK